MSPAAIRALVGKLLTPAVNGRGPQTIRFRVLGFSSRAVRVRAVDSGRASELELGALDDALTRGLLRVED